MFFYDFTNLVRNPRVNIVVIGPGSFQDRRCVPPWGLTTWPTFHRLRIALRASMPFLAISGSAGFGGGAGKNCLCAGSLVVWHMATNSGNDGGHFALDFFTCSIAWPIWLTSMPAKDLAHSSIVSNIISSSFISCDPKLGNIALNLASTRAAILRSLSASSIRPDSCCGIFPFWIAPRCAPMLSSPSLGFFRPSIRLPRSSPQMLAG